jgi:hypothetical protein
LTDDSRILDAEQYSGGGRGPNGKYSDSKNDIDQVLPVPTAAPDLEAYKQEFDTFYQEFSALVPEEFIVGALGLTQNLDTTQG